LEKIKAVIFDLDGTLTDSLPGLHLSINDVLQKYYFPPVSIEKCRSIVGRGLEDFVRASLPDNTDEITFENCYNEMIRCYNKYIFTGTSLYNFIPSFLDYLSGLNIKMAILSNKRQEAVDIIHAKMLSGWNFQVVKGAIPNSPLKPHPQACENIISTIKAEKSQTCYIGDGESDIVMAKNAGITSIAVCWGYRNYEQLKPYHPDYLINDPFELTQIFE